MAALNHPNILQVYDWGEEDDEPYLVLEYLAGGSLRQVYDTGALLTPEQAVQVGLAGRRRPRLRPPPGPDPPGHQAGQPALRRRPTPADRRLRAGPGPGRGGVDRAGRGHPGHGPLRRPRAGRGVGARRQGRRLRPGPGALRGGHRRDAVHRRHHHRHPDGPGRAPCCPSTTPWARSTTSWCGRPPPSPSERFDAAQFSLRLEELAATLPEPRPLPIVDAVPVDEVGRPGQGDGPSRSAGRSSTGRPPTPPSSAFPPWPGRGRPRRRRSAAPKSRPRRRRRPAAGRAPRPGPIRPRRRRWPWIVAIVVVVLALVAGGVVLAVQAKLFTPSHPVPVAGGQDGGPGPTRPSRPTSSPCAPTGHASSITVAAGPHPAASSPRPRPAATPATAKQGSTIGVVVSTGPPPVAIPDLTSFTSLRRRRRRPCKAVHLVGVCPAAAEQYSSTVVAGAVLGTAPTGTAPYGSTVTVITSKGHAPVAIPAVTGIDLHLRHGRRRPHRRRLRARAEQRRTARPCPPARSSAPPPTPSAGPQPFGSKVSREHLPRAPAGDHPQRGRAVGDRGHRRPRRPWA